MNSKLFFFFFFKSLQVYIYVCACLGINVGIYTSVLLRVRGQPQVSVFGFFPSLSGSTEIIAIHYCTQFPMGSGSLNIDPHAPVVDTLPTEPFLQPTSKL